MYSTISEEEYKLLQRNGELECDATKARFPAESEEVAIAYKFMADKLRERYPSCLEYPRWAFTQYDGKDVSLKPDAFFADRPNQRKYRLKLDVKEFLLSDFDAWHCCLNLWPLAYAEGEDAKFDYWRDVAHLSYRDVFFNDNVYARNLRDKTIKTWDRIFDINAQSEYALYKDKSIQAVFWRIYQEDILGVKEILVDDKTFREYHEW